MGQPMSSSYENRWLSAGDEATAKKGSPLVTHRKSIANEENASSSKNPATPSTPNKEKKLQKENSRPPHNPNEPPKKAQKDMTKAERRDMQEKQRLEKQNRIAAGLPKSAKQAAELETKTGAVSASKSTTTATTSGAATTTDASEANKQKKKALNKNQQNLVPWLLHLDAPKTSEALTKDLHPAVLQLGLYFSEHKIVGSNARCVAMLEIFSKVSFLQCFIR
jgi:translation initiation factor eIF-2B subunit delta